MGRIFRRGELKQAIVAVLADLGDAHGYAIMGELETRVGQGWKASPGAIYPALLALVESGHLRSFVDNDVRMYALTDTGRKALNESDWQHRWASLSDRAEEAEDRVAVGPLLDAFASQSPLRRRLAGRPERHAIAQVLTQAHHQIEVIMRAGEDNG